MLAEALKDYNRFKVTQQEPAATQDSMQVEPEEGLWGALTDKLNSEEFTKGLQEGVMKGSPDERGKMDIKEALPLIVKEVVQAMKDTVSKMAQKEKVDGGGGATEQAVAQEAVGATHGSKLKQRGTDGGADEARERSRSPR
eukprot:13661265-Alexandrium_andersonii.AAC.1